MSNDDDDGWERPIGLLPEEAICIDSSDDDDEDEDALVADGEATNTNGSSVASLGETDDRATSNPSFAYLREVHRNVAKSGSKSKTISSYFVKQKPTKRDRAGTTTTDTREPICKSDDDKQDNIDAANDKSSGSDEYDDEAPTNETSEDHATTCTQLHDGMDVLNQTTESDDIKGDIADTSSNDNINQTDRTQSTEHEAMDDVNPFACFAFQSASEQQSTSGLSLSIQPRKRQNETPTPHNQHSSKKIATSSSAQPSFRDTIQNKQQLQECIHKWHSFSDPSAPLEQRRFQVLIAARLHARCQESVVRTAMYNLRKHFSEKQNDEVEGVVQEGAASQSVMRGLTPQSLANADHETEIANLLSSVHYCNTKSKQIVEASQNIMRKFGGEVPESKNQLQEITGIGPKLAEILTVVNTRSSYS